MKHKTFHELWSVFEVLANVAVIHHFHFAIEWPRTCTYWRNRKVIMFLSQHTIYEADFDGCMFGLRSIVREDMLIKKPWKVITTCYDVFAALNVVYVIKHTTTLHVRVVIPNRQNNTHNS